MGRKSQNEKKSMKGGGGSKAEGTVIRKGKNKGKVIGKKGKPQNPAKQNKYPHGKSHGLATQSTIISDMGGQTASISVHPSMGDYEKPAVERPYESDRDAIISLNRWFAKYHDRAAAIAENGYSNKKTRVFAEDGANKLGSGINPGMVTKSDQTEFENRVNLLVDSLKDREFRTKEDVLIPPPCSVDELVFPRSDQIKKIGVYDPVSSSYITIDVNVDFKKYKPHEIHTDSTRMPVISDVKIDSDGKGAKGVFNPDSIDLLIEDITKWSAGGEKPLGTRLPQFVKQQISPNDVELISLYAREEAGRGYDYKLEEVINNEPSCQSNEAIYGVYDASQRLGVTVTINSDGEGTVSKPYLATSNGIDVLFEKLGVASGHIVKEENLKNWTVEDKPKYGYNIPRPGEPWGGGGWHDDPDASDTLIEYLIEKFGKPEAPKLTTGVYKFLYYDTESTRYAIVEFDLAAGTHSFKVEGKLSKHEVSDKARFLGVDGFIEEYTAQLCLDGMLGDGEAFLLKSDTSEENIERLVNYIRTKNHIGVETELLKLVVAKARGAIASDGKTPVETVGIYDRYASTAVILEIYADKTGKVVDVKPHCGGSFQVDEYFSEHGVTEILKKNDLAYDWFVPGKGRFDYNLHLDGISDVNDDLEERLTEYLIAHFEIKFGDEKQTEAGAGLYRVGIYADTNGVGLVLEIGDDKKGKIIGYEAFSDSRSIDDYFDSVGITHKIKKDNIWGWENAGGVELGFSLAAQQDYLKSDQIEKLTEYAIDELGLKFGDESGMYRNAVSEADVVKQCVYFDTSTNWYVAVDFRADGTYEITRNIDSVSDVRRMFADKGIDVISERTMVLSGSGEFGDGEAFSLDANTDPKDLNRIIEYLGKKYGAPTAEQGGQSTLDSDAGLHYGIYDNAAGGYLIINYADGEPTFDDMVYCSERDARRILVDLDGMIMYRNLVSCSLGGHIGNLNVSLPKPEEKLSDRDALQLIKLVDTARELRGGAVQYDFC